MNKANKFGVGLHESFFVILLYPLPYLLGDLEQLGSLETIIGQLNFHPPLPLLTCSNEIISWL